MLLIYYSNIYDWDKSKEVNLLLEHHSFVSIYDCNKSK